MSIRDELADAIWNVETRDLGGVTQRDSQTIADAVLARFAVVERPEPNGGPMGIEWTRKGDHVCGRVLALDDGASVEILTVTYTLEQAAKVAGQLIDALGGRR
jgi:hypothetical protein